MMKKQICTHTHTFISDITRYRQSLAFIHNSFLKRCTKVEQQTCILQEGSVLTALSTHKFVFMGNKHNISNKNYGTFSHKNSTKEQQPILMLRSTC
jgi:hypothetical protein